MALLPETIEAEHVDETSLLRKEIDDLREEVRSLREEFKQFANVVMSARIAFGKVPTGASSPMNTDSEKWDKLKVKLGGKMAQIIDALQLSGKATRTQLKNQTGGALTTVDQAVYKLRDMGLLVKNGDGWSLKP